MIETDTGFRDVVGPRLVRGETVAVKLITPEKLLTLVRTIRSVAEPPLRMVREVVLAKILKSGGGGGGTTVKVTVVECAKLPLVP